MRPISVAGVLFVAAGALLAAPKPAIPDPAHRPFASVRATRAAATPDRSIGSPNEGHLEGGVRLEASPELRILPGHENRWGLAELVGMLERSAKRVARKFPGSVLEVGDLSRRGGGDLAGHHSHESGRDADVAFFLVDDHGRPKPATRLLQVDEKGNVAGHLHFDDARNWALVEAWLTDPVARVRRIFVADHLRDRLLAHARRVHASPQIRSRAAEAMFQPKGSLVHDDHFHVRIACPAHQSSTCVEYVTHERDPKKVAKRRPVVAKARKRIGSSGAPPPVAAGIVPAPNDFDDGPADDREVAQDEDEAGEPLLAR